MGCIENIGLFKHYDRIDSGKNISTLSRVYKVIGIQCHGVQGVLVGRWHWWNGHHMEGLGAIFGSVMVNVLRSTCCGRLSSLYLGTFIAQREA